MAGRLPDALRLGPVRLQVGELERSLSWYGRVLGTRVLERTANGAKLGAADGTPLVELVAVARSEPPRGRLGLYHYAILLPDRAALGRFVTHLAAIGERAGASDHRVSEALYLTDPDGLGIEVYADRPRETWQWRGSELSMGTAPLDIGSVVRSAGGATWTGLPAGTKMGHVHLHVGDIARAAAFYETAIGLDVVVRGYPGALFLSAGGYHHHLGLNTWAGPGARPASETDARLLEWRIVLPGADAVAGVVDRLRETGHAVAADADGWRVADPWGTVVRIGTA